MLMKLENVSQLKQENNAERFPRNKFQYCTQNNRCTEFISHKVPIIAQVFSGIFVKGNIWIHPIRNSWSHPCLLFEELNKKPTNRIYRFQFSNLSEISHKGPSIRMHTNTEKRKCGHRRNKKYLPCSCLGSKKTWKEIFIHEKLKVIC